MLQKTIHFPSVSKIRSQERKDLATLNKIRIVHFELNQKSLKSFKNIL